ncbi:MAG: hypothetical protein ACR2RE_27385, partial [Geminicoccaceae bacterium]
VDEREFERDLRRPILIFTVGRSGSSMVAGLLWVMGCWIGYTRYGDDWNPRGYFENTALKKLLKKTFGFELLRPFPAASDGWRDAVAAELKAQGYRRGPWLFKTGVHYAGVWGEFDPIVVKVMRNRDQILESYRRYGGIWHSLGDVAATEVIDRGLDRLAILSGIEVDSEKLVAGNYSGIEKVCQRACLPFNARAVHDFIIPGAFNGG